MRIASAAGTGGRAGSARAAGASRVAGAAWAAGKSIAPALMAIALALPAVALAQAPTPTPAPQTAVPEAPRAPEAPEAPRVNDFPTQARVEYVYECMQENGGASMQEMFYKCICAADAVAARISYERWVELSVFNAARPMAGERGAYVRERKDSSAMMKAYRELQTGARNTCFIRQPEAR